jgi:hypothetical protein
MLDETPPALYDFLQRAACYLHLDLRLPPDILRLEPISAVGYMPLLGAAQCE